MEEQRGAEAAAGRRAVEWAAAAATVAGAALAAVGLPALGAYIVRLLVPELTGVGIVAGAALGWPLALWLTWQPRRG